MNDPEPTATTGIAALTRRLLIGAALMGGVAPLRVLGQGRPDRHAGTDGGGMKIEITFSRHVFTATLSDNPSACDFAALLPLDLSIDDYAANEKIAYLPRKLTEAESGPFGNEAPGDLCYYAPWGNLAFFYDSYRYSRGLIRIGRLDGGYEPLLTRGKFPLRIDLRRNSP